MNIEMSKREELSDGELDGVNGGGIVETAQKVWRWLWTPSDEALHSAGAGHSPTGGGGVRG
jgi:hypothetical protein